MADRLSPAARSAVMRKVKGRHTGPERRVRRLLHAAGYRFRIQFPFGRKRLDIAFAGRKRAVLVHGCFWHGHDCARGRLPQTNTAFWRAKIERNAARDGETILALAAEGWTALSIWECELKDEASLLPRLRAFLGPPVRPTEARPAHDGSDPRRDLRVPHGAG